MSQLVSKTSRLPSLVSQEIGSFHYVVVFRHGSSTFLCHEEIVSHIALLPTYVHFIRICWPGWSFSLKYLHFVDSSTLYTAPQSPGRVKGKAIKKLWPLMQYFFVVGKIKSKWRVHKTSSRKLPTFFECLYLLQIISRVTSGLAS